MAEQEHDRKLDKMLDGLLSAYSAAEPRPGLETRILANLKEASARKSAWRWGFGWVWAGAATAAALAILLTVYFSRPQRRLGAPQIVQHAPQRESQPSPASQEESGPAPAGSAKSQSGRQQRQQLAKLQPAQAHNVTVVRQEVFPSPSPLSDQEKLLFLYLAGTPREELVAQSHPDEPPPVDGEPQDQSALPVRGSTNQTSNTR
jgi:hypothetical protein